MYKMENRFNRCLGGKVKELMNTEKMWHDAKKFENPYTEPWLPGYIHQSGLFLLSK